MLAVSGEDVYLVRLLTYLPGQRVHIVPYTTQLLYQLGQTLADFNNALQVTLNRLHNVRQKVVILYVYRPIQSR